MGLAEKTIVFLTSDNGATAEAASYGHIPMLPGGERSARYTKAGIAFPSSCGWPGKVRSGMVSNETICLTDFMALVLPLPDIRLAIRMQLTATTFCLYTW